MARLIVATLMLVIVAGCTAQQIDDGRACASALIASGQRDPAALAQVARVTTPACQALAADVVQWAIREAMLRPGR